MDDPYYWLETRCRTQDQHRPDLRSRPFPKEKDQPYLYAIAEKLHTCTRVIAPKSRQLMLSWLVVAYTLWATQFHRNIWTFYISLKKSHASKLVDRAKFIYRCQGFSVGALNEIHTTQRVRGDIGTSNTFPFYPPLDELKKGARDKMSIIEGLSQDPDEIRMNTATYVVYDEDAFSPKSPEGHRALISALGEIGAVYDVSSPNGKNHFYYRVNDREETADSVTDKGAVVPEIMRGLKIWENSDNGYTVCRVHYTVDKYRDPNRVVCKDCGYHRDIRGASGKKCPKCGGVLREFGKRWKAKTKRGMTDADWLQEQEISFASPKGKRVFPNFRDGRHIGVCQVPPRPLLYRGWDFGRHYPAVVVCYDNSTFKSFQIIETFLGYDIDFLVFCDEVIKHCKQRWPGAMWMEGIDPQGAWRNPQGGMIDRNTQSETPKDYMENKHNLDVDWQYVDPRDMQDLLRREMLLSPADSDSQEPFLVQRTDTHVICRLLPDTQVRVGTTILIDGLSGHCVFGSHHDGTYSDSMVKNIYSHPADALCHAFLRARKQKEEAAETDNAELLYRSRQQRPPQQDNWGAPSF
jgi:hypothetical protein